MQVCFCQFFEYIGADEMDEVIDFLTSTCILIAKGVEDDAAVDVDILAERVVLQCIAGVDNWGGHILFLLSGLLAQEGLVVFEVLEGGLDAHVHFALQNFDHLAVQGQTLRPPTVPLLQHLGVRVFFLERNLGQHLHLLLLQLSVILHELAFLGRGGKGFVEV